MAQRKARKKTSSRSRTAEAGEGSDSAAIGRYVKAAGQIKTSLTSAIKHLKRKMANEGILRELKRRRHYMKPSIKKRKKEAEAARRRRKRIRQIAEGT